MNALGDYLKSVRTRLGLSLRQAAELSEVSNPYLSMLERGARVSPHPNVLKKLATAYGVPLEKIMKVAGYLNVSDREKEEIEVDLLFDRAISDPEFAYGTRFRGTVDPAIKKVVAEMYRKLKSKKGQKG